MVRHKPTKRSRSTATTRRADAPTPYAGRSGPVTVVRPVQNPQNPPEPRASHGVPEGSPHATTAVVLDIMGLPSYVWPTCSCDGEPLDRPLQTDPFGRPATRETTLWVPETLPWSLTCRDGGRC